MYHYELPNTGPNAERCCHKVDWSFANSLNSEKDEKDYA